MEKFNFIANLIIITYIIVKDMDKLKNIINSIINSISNTIAVGDNSIINDTVIEDYILSDEDLNSEDFLLATCIIVDEDGNETVVDYDLRGDSAAPLNFSMFGGSKDQHYDISIVKCFNGEIRNTASYYAFDNTVEDLKRHNKILKDYVIISRITLDQIKYALNKDNVQAIDINNDYEYSNQDEAVLINAINSGIGNTELYKTLLNLYNGGKEATCI